MILPPHPSPRRRSANAFTLIELLLASMGAALVLAALYGIFIHAIHLRDTATAHVRDARLRARVESVIRTDLRNAYISGGLIASSLTGGTTDSSGPAGSSLPGYLKLTTTTGRDTGADLYGDVQQVEDYLEKDPDAPSGASNQGGSILVRAITRDLLDTTTVPARKEQILGGVQSLAVEFYDGSTWQQSWDYDSTAAALTSGNDSSSGTVIAMGNTTLPDAIRISVQQAAAAPGGPVPPPVEVLVPWTTQAFASATPSADASTAAAATATPTPTATPRPTPPDGGEPGGPGSGQPTNVPPASGGSHSPR